MKKKFLTVFLIIAILFTNYAFVFAAGTTLKYSRTNGQDIRSVGKQIDDNTYISPEFNAKIQPVIGNKIEIYQYESNNLMNMQGSYVSGDEIPQSVHWDNSPNKMYYYFQPGKDTDLYDRVSAMFRITKGSRSIQDVATILYRDGAIYNGEIYDVKVNIKEIRVVSDLNDYQVLIRLGYRNHSNQNTTDLNTYLSSDVKPLTPNFNIGGISVTGNSFSASTQEGYGIEMDLELYLLDKKGTAKPFAGVLGITDIDLMQGMFVKDFEINANNTFYSKNYNNNSTHIVDVKSITENGNSGTFIYDMNRYQNSTDARNAANNTDGSTEVSAYLTLNSKQNKVDLTMFSTYQSGDLAVTLNSNLPDVEKHYIATNCVGGTITPSIENIEHNAAGPYKIEYAPTGSNVLKSVTVDGQSVSTTTYPNSYSFSNITENHVISVIYEQAAATKYTVEFDTKGGTPATIPTQQVEKNEKATKPTDPTKRGYTFDGWKKTGETTNYDFNTPVTSNIKLEAQWTPIKYKIEYEPNGGTNPNTITEYTIESNTITFKDPTKTGYEFKGWYTEEDFQNVKTEIPKGSTGDVKIYAKWEAVPVMPYVVEHYKQNADGTYPTKATVTDNSKKAAIGKKVTAEPKTFSGYTEDTTYTGRVPSGTIPETGTLTLKRYYKMEEYKITYVTDGGTNHPDNPGTYTINSDTITFKDPTKEGYNFLGWYEDEAKTIAKSEIPNGSTGDVTVYAKWEKAEKTNGLDYRIEHYKQNEDGTYPTTTTDVETKQGNKGEQVVATPKTYEGYEEDTTYSGRVASGTIPAEGTTLVLKLYYKLVNYKINYVLNGGENDPENPDTYKAGDVIDLKDPTRDGYEFEGWFEDEDFTKPIDSIAGRTEDITVHAKWKAATVAYKIEYYKEDKDGEYKLELEKEKFGETDTEATAEILEFEGYKENTTHKDRKVKGIIKGDGSLVLKVYYERIRHTVSFDPQNGEKIDDQIVPHNDTAKEPTKPTQAGYEFIDWYYTDENGEERVYDFDKPVKSDLQLIAKWKPVADDTKADKPIPQTGENNMMVITIIALVTLAGVSGIKYLNFKRKMK